MPIRNSNHCVSWEKISFINSISIIEIYSTSMYINTTAVNLKWFDYILSLCWIINRLSTLQYNSEKYERFKQNPVHIIVCARAVLQICELRGKISTRSGLSLWNVTRRHLQYVSKVGKKFILRSCLFNCSAEGKIIPNYNFVNTLRTGVTALQSWPVENKLPENDKWWSNFKNTLITHKP